MWFEVKVDGPTDQNFLDFFQILLFSSVFREFFSAPLHEENPASVSEMRKNGIIE